MRKRFPRRLERLLGPPLRMVLVFHVFVSVQFLNFQDTLEKRTAACAQTELLLWTFDQFHQLHWRPPNTLAHYSKEG
jgi:hypothetical protein